MPTIIEVFENFQKLNVREKIPQIVEAKQYELILKVQNQHVFGLSGTGNKITPSYAGKLYSQFKESLNPSAGYGIPDVKVTGAYNDGMSLKIEGDNYVIDSDVSYAQSASINQYGNSLNLPTDQSKGEYWNEVLAPEIIDYIKEETGL